MCVHRDWLRRLHYVQGRSPAYSAKRRVDPSNRLVADTLEALWNDKLRQLEQAREDYEKQRESGGRTSPRSSRRKSLRSPKTSPGSGKIPQPATASESRRWTKSHVKPEGIP